MYFRKAFHWYLSCLHNKPLITKSITSFFLLGTGDLLTQTIIIQKQLQPSLTTNDNNKAENSNKPKNQAEKYNFYRTLKMASYGLLLIGPSLHLWYKFLHSFITSNNTMLKNGQPLTINITTKKIKFFNALKQMIMDQTIWAPYSIFQFLTYMGLIEGHLFKEIYEKIKKDLFSTLIVHWMIWPFVQLINFIFIPLHLRVLFVNFIAIFWNAYLSFVQYNK